jgi:hypothetical protein
MNDFFSDIADFIPIAVTILIIVVAMGGQYLYNRRVRQKWTDLAARTGLTVDIGGTFARPTVGGTYRGRPLQLYTFTRGSGRSKSTYTAVSIATNSPAGWSLSLRPERWYDPLAKSLGMKDVEIGDAMFDQRFRVNANPPEIAIAVLRGNEVLRSTLMQAPPFNIELKSGFVQHNQRGFESNIERLEALFNVMSDVADAVETVAGGDCRRFSRRSTRRAGDRCRGSAAAYLARQAPAGGPRCQITDGSQPPPGPSDPPARSAGLSDDTKRTR